MSTKMYGLIKRKDGFQLAEFCISSCYSGGLRRFRRTYDLKYKKEDFAKKKAESFFGALYAHCDCILKYIGVVPENLYQGEPHVE